MSFHNRVKQIGQSFTKNEVKIVDYMIENVEKVLKKSVQELAKEIGVSPASIIRLSKKLGYTGLQDLKIDVAKNQNEIKEDMDYILKDSDSLTQVVEKFTYGIERVCKETAELINISALKEAIQKLIEAETIYLYGIGSSSLIAQDLYQKLTRINKRCVYHIDSHVNLAAAPHIKNTDVVIAISYSGETKEVLLPVEEGRKNGAHIISIVKFGTSPLVGMSDTNLYCLNVEKEIRVGAIYSRYSALFIIDLLFLGLARENYDEIEKLLTNTRRFTRKMR